MASADTPLAGSRLQVEEVPIVVYCGTCKAQREIKSAQWFCCPECRTPTSEVVQGKELELVALEIQ
jgi:hydrogenase nickel incorporation protein HypA/HybF